MNWPKQRELGARSVLVVAELVVSGTGDARSLSTQFVADCHLEMERADAIVGSFLSKEPCFLRPLEKVRLAIFSFHDDPLRLCRTTVPSGGKAPLDYLSHAAA